MESTEPTKQPVWRVMVDTLRREILAGAYPPERPIPPEGEIAERFSVSRMTARKALAALQDEGFVRIERGRGTFVYGDVVDYEIGAHTRFSENLTKLSVVPGRLLLEERVLAANDETARSLGLPADTDVLMLRVLGSADGRVISLGRNFYQTARFRGLGDAFRQMGSLTQALMLFGVESYVRKRTRLIARLPTPEEARLLQQPRNRPIVETTGVDVDGNGRPVAHCVTCFASDRVQFIVDSDR